MDYSEEVYRWQLVSSKVIFWVVLTVVGVGLVLSWLHFHRSFQEDDKDKKSLEKSHSSEQSTIYAFGVKISSSVIGLVILAISIIFLYLYLKFVYPINL